MTQNSENYTNCVTKVVIDKKRHEFTLHCPHPRYSIYMYRTILSGEVMTEKLFKEIIWIENTLFVQA